MTGQAVNRSSADRRILFIVSFSSTSNPLITIRRKILDFSLLNVVVCIQCILGGRNLSSVPAQHLACELTVSCPALFSLHAVRAIIPENSFRFSSLPIPLLLRLLSFIILPDLSYPLTLIKKELNYYLFQSLPMLRSPRWAKSFTISFFSYLSSRRIEKKLL